MGVWKSDVGGWPTFSVRDYPSRLSVGAPLLSPAFGDGVGTIFTRGSAAEGSWATIVPPFGLRVP